MPKEMLEMQNDDDDSSVEATTSADQAGPFSIHIINST